MYSWSKKKKIPPKGNTPSNFNTNYRRKMKLVPINMDQCLLSFYSFKFSLGGSLHGVFTYFFPRKPPNLTARSQINLIEFFTTFLTLVCELLDVGIISNASFEEKSFFF